MTTERDLGRLSRVVGGRSKIQSLAYDLLWLMNKRREVRSSSGRDRNSYDILVGATFSLWRAIVLADSVQDWGSVLADAETFLEKLVRDNTISYIDDWNNRDWSFVYYLNNARFRLRELAETVPEFKAALEKDSIPQLLDHAIVGSYSLATWDLDRGFVRLGPDRKLRPYDSLSRWTG